ncbi:hypothetical protein ISN44_As10g012930, partial [Arabidopsis suecica]
YVETKEHRKQSCCCCGSREECLASDRSREGKTSDSQVFTIVPSSISSWPYGDLDVQDLEFVLLALCISDLV